MQLRVAHIISGLRIGGAERQVVNLLNAMQCDQQTLITIGAPSGEETFDDKLHGSVELLAVPVRRRRLLRSILRLQRELRRRRINVVHTHMYESNLFGSIAAALARIPVVVTSEHGENPWKGPFQRWLERNVISAIADVRLCVSPRILECRRKIDGVSPDKLQLMVNGTELPERIDDPRAVDVVTVGAVGRMIPAKDYPLLIKATASLIERGCRLNLCIVGDGPCRPELESLVQRLGVGDSVRFPGMVTNVNEWYRRFDVFVVSSKREGLPMVLLEAMAHGIPVVSTDAGACSEVVNDGDGGLVVPTGDRVALAAAIETLIRDQDKRVRMGNNARRRVEDNYSVVSVARRHLELYGRLLDAKGASK